MVRDGERVRRRLGAMLRFKFEMEVEGRVGETEVECSKEATRRLLDCVWFWEDFRAMVVVIGVEILLVCIARNGFRSFNGEYDGFVGGAMDVGVVDACREGGVGGAEEK